MLRYLRIASLAGLLAIAAAMPPPALAQSAKQAAAERLAQAREKSPDPAAAELARASELELQGFALQQEGEVQQALDLYAQTLRIRREVLGPSHPDTIIALENVAFAHESLSQVREAISLYEEAWRLRSEAQGENHPDTITSLNDYARILEVAGQSASALPLLAKTVELSREVHGPRHEGTLTAQANYGRVLFSLGRLDESEAVLRDTLAAARAEHGDMHDATLATLSFYASVIEAQGRIEEAALLHEQDLRLNRKRHGSRSAQAIGAQGNYAKVLLTLGRFDESAAMHEEVLALSRDVFGDENPATLTIQINYAVLLDKMARLEEAMALFTDLLPKAQAVLGIEHPITLLTINGMATLAGNAGQYTQASEIYEKALPYFRSSFGERHHSTLQVTFNYAVASIASGQNAKALGLARELTGIMRERAVDLGGGGVRDAAQRERELPQRQSYESLYADVLWGNREQPGLDFETLSLEAFNALQLASAGRTSNAVREAAAARFASARGLTEIVEERQLRVRDWELLEEQLVASEAGGAGSRSARTELRNQLDAVEQRIAAIDARLASEAPEFFAILAQQAVTIEGLRRVLGKDEAVLFLVPTAFGTHSMAVTSDATGWNFASLPAPEIEEKVAELRDGLEVGQGGEYLPLFDLALAHSLYRQLVAPVEQALAGKARVYVISGGALSRLPLGTLTTSAPTGESLTDDPDTLRSAPWLGDRYALVQLPSLQSLVYIRSFSDAAHTSDGFAGFGAPVLGGEATTRGARSATLAPVDAANLLSDLRGGRGTPLMNPDALRSLSSLPGTRSELQQVRAALGASERSLFLAEAMTETAIRDADLSDVAILHLATHGFTSEEAGDAAEPGLVFTPPDKASMRNDGYLAASEVVSLNLAAARWVILSACNTAAPSGNTGETGLSGLAQAFFYAGAQSLLVSHWPVFDDIAPVLTVEALKRSQAGEPRAEALQAAMKKVREDPGMDAAHPAVWAPFTLVGEGR